MKLILESTQKNSLLQKGETTFELQIWKGKTEKGIPVVVGIAFLQINTETDAGKLKQEIADTGGDTGTWHIIQAGG